MGVFFIVCFQLLRNGSGYHRPCRHKSKIDIYVTLHISLMWPSNIYISPSALGRYQFQQDKEQKRSNNGVTVHACLLLPSTTMNSGACCAQNEQKFLLQNVTFSICIVLHDSPLKFKKKNHYLYWMTYSVILISLRVQQAKANDYFAILRHEETG